MKIGIVAWSILKNVGGIERLCCDFAAELLSRGHHVTMLCQAVAPGKKELLCRVPEGVALETLKLDYDTARLDAARSILTGQDFDVFVALFSWESLLWFPALLKGSGIPLVISEHNRPDWINSKWNAYERHCCLECADRIHVLLPGFVPEYPERLQERITVIPNPAFVPEAACRPAVTSGKRTIIAAGRLVEEPKQFSLLLKAFALLADRYPDWDLEICGDGPSRKEYMRLAEKSGLRDRLRLPGMVDDLGRRYAAADIFCIPSKVEGFGLVLVEAQAYELPAVGFAVCAGVNDIIKHGENGCLAEEMTPECLARHLAELMDDPGLRRRMGDRGKKMLERYDPKKVYDAWENLLFETARCKGKTRLQTIEAMGRNGDADTRGARELLARTHPFDRSHYLSMHTKRQAEGKPSPFSEKEIAGFIKKQKKFGFPHYRSPLVELKRLGRRLAGWF